MTLFTFFQPTRDALLEAASSTAASPPRDKLPEELTLAQIDHYAEGCPTGRRVAFDATVHGVRLGEANCGHTPISLAQRKPMPSSESDGE